MVKDPEFADLLVNKEEALRQLSTLLEQIEGISPNHLGFLHQWYNSAITTIEACFASDSVVSYFESNCGFIYDHLWDGKSELRSANVLRAKGILKRIISRIDGKLSNNEKTEQRAESRKVFIVHGHNNEVLLDVARCLTDLRLDPVILHEQPSRGATIIEKFERNSDVGFAIILVTPDDEGRTKGEQEFSDRARQNVVLEMGYFIGKLGRDRVMVLRKGEVEQPSDVIGVVYETLDDKRAWQFALCKELRAAGYDVDLNKLL